MNIFPSESYKSKDKILYNFVCYDLYDFLSHPTYIHYIKSECDAH